jgi:hypothetical protein
MAYIGRKWPESYQTTDDPLGTSFLMQRSIRAEIDNIFKIAISEMNPLRCPDLLNLRIGLWDQAGLRTTP